MTSSEAYDVVVVGGRCAGSPLATLLARERLRVAVVERASFPRDTLSTHIFQAPAIAFLDRLGVTEQIHATGARYVNRLQARVQDVEFSVAWPEQPGDLGGVTSVRRFVLDPILAEAAAQAGADMRMASTVTGLVQDRGRVAGVRVVHAGRESVLKARLVVGADGRDSTIARLVGARKYNLTPNERFGYWAFFEGARPGPDPAILIQRWDDRFVIGCPADDGLYQVIVIPDLRELPRFRTDLGANFMEHALSSEPVADVLSSARRTGKFFGMLRWEGFFREPSGPGWVLVGDACHFKDPAPGQGIADAFRQIDTLASTILGALDRSEETLDRALAKWGRWREKDAAEHYWFAVDLGRAGPIPTPLPELTKRLLARGRIDQYINLFNHRTRPSKVISPPRVLAASGRLLAQRGCDRRALLREVQSLVAQDARRKRLDRRPVYIDAGDARDAGPTEVEDPSSRRSALGGRLRPVALTWTASQPARGRILLLHGVMSSAGTWHRVGAELAARGWECLAVDLPGHGSAPPMRGSLDLDTLARGVLAQLAVPVDVVVGHSLGGIVALALAGRVRDGVRALVLEDPPGLRGVDIDALRSQIAIDAATARVDLDALRRREREANPGWSDADVEQSIAGVAAAQADAVIDALAGALSWDLCAMIDAERRRPILVLAGREAQGTFPFADGGSALTGRDRADARRLLSDDRFVEIDGGHCLHRDAPDRWLAAVGKFIEPVSGGRDGSALAAPR